MAKNLAITVPFHEFENTFSYENDFLQERKWTEITRLLYVQKQKLSTVFNHRWENPNKYPGGLSIFLFVVTSKEVNIVVVICSRFGGLGLCWCGSASTWLSFEASYTLLEGQDQVTKVFSN